MAKSNGSVNGINGSQPPTPTGQEQITTNEMLDRFLTHVENESAFSRQMFNRLLDPRRDIEDECGYPRIDMPVNIELMRLLYDREAIAARVVEVLPKESWQSQPSIFEDEDADTETEFETAWNGLADNLRGNSWFHQEEGSPIWDHLCRADILSGIGHFGIILLGIGDGLPLDQPVDGVLVVDGTGQPQPESELHPEEEKQLQEVAAGRATQDVPDFTNPKMGSTKKVPIPPLNEPERATVNRWIRHRELVGNFLKIGAPLVNAVQQASAAMRNPSSGFSPGDVQLGSSGISPIGTDQQYFGVQFGTVEELNPDASTMEKPLVFIRSFDESLVQIVRYEWNVRSPRFGMPTMYRVTLNDPREQHSGIGLPMATVFVHWSRIIHVADNLRSSEIFGVPRMRPVLNNLLGLRKMYGASPEGYWKSCFNILSLETHPQLGGDVKMDVQKHKDIMEKLMNSLDRTAVWKGSALKSIAPSIVDPTPFIDAQKKAICNYLSIPIRVFDGSERGELASSQDDASWNDRLRHRQQFYLTPRIIVPFVDRLIQCGVLPKPTAPKQVIDRTQGSQAAAQAAAQAGSKPGEGGPPGMGGDPAGTTEDTGKPAPPISNRVYRGKARAKTRWKPRWVTNVDGSIEAQTLAGYSIKWPDLDSMTDKDRAAVFAQRMTAYSTYVTGKIEAIIPPHEVMTKFDILTEDEAHSILEAAEAAQQATMTMPGVGMDGHPTSEALPNYPVDPETGKPMFPEIPEGSTVQLGGGSGPPQTGPDGKPLPPGAGDPNAEPADDGPTREGVKDLLGNRVLIGNVFCATGEGGGVDATCSPGDTGSGGEHGSHGTEGHEGHAGHVPEETEDVAETGFKVETVKDAQEIGSHIASILGGGHEHAAEAVRQGHEAASAAHGVHAPSGGGAHGGAHVPSSALISATVASYYYTPALHAATAVMSHIPGARRVGEFIAKVHEGTLKAVESLTAKMAERYGPATAGAILATGIHLSHTVGAGIGVGHMTHAFLPHEGKAMVGALPLVAMAEIGKQLGVVGKDSKLDHAIGKTVGKMLGIVDATKELAGKAVLKTARTAGKVVGKAIGTRNTLTVLDIDYNYGAILTNDQFTRFSQTQINALARQFLEDLFEQTKELTTPTEDDEVINTFCATGDGGGVDPTCPAGQDGGRGKKPSSAKQTAEKMLAHLDEVGSKGWNGEVKIADVQAKTGASFSTADKALRQLVKDGHLMYDLQGETFHHPNYIKRNDTPGMGHYKTGRDTFNN